MSRPRFGTGLVHGVVAAQSDARLAHIADAFDVGEVIGAAADPHVMLISNVPQHLQADIEANTLFSDAARISILAMAHHRILQTAAGITDVVPIRLGTLVSWPTGARDLMAREAARFSDRLAAIRNAVEFAIRILPDPQARRVSPMQANSGREYLRLRRNARASGRPAAVDIVLRELARRAVANHERQPVPRRPGQPPAVAEAAFLVDRGKLAAFAACAARIERQIAGSGLALDVFGPLPAYSFVDRGPEDQA